MWTTKNIVIKKKTTCMFDALYREKIFYSQVFT